MFRIIFFVLNLIVFNTFARSNEKISIFLPESFDILEFPINSNMLTCIGEKIDFSFILLSDSFATFFNINVTIPKEIFWEKVFFSKELKIKGFNNYSFLGGKENIFFWKSSQGFANLNVANGNFLADKNNFQIQANCRLKFKNWNN